MRKFSVTVTGNVVRVDNEKTGEIKRYDVRAFVYGQSMYNEDTEQYPNYIHSDIWRLHRIEENKDLIDDRQLHELLKKTLTTKKG